MRRISDSSFQIEPYDLCYCGSDKKVKFCHPLRRNRNIPRPSTSSCKPPGPKTGYAHPGCYARLLNDCGEDISGEHLFSEVMLNLLRGADGKVCRTGYPWQAEGDVQALTPANCKANVLCKRHNNALSPLDDAGGRFLKVILDTPNTLKGRNSRVLLFSGDNLERWILKTLCTHVVAAGKFGKEWTPPLGWLQILWEMAPFPEGCGLYFNREVGQSSPDNERLGFRVLTCRDIVGPTGATVELGAHQFALAMVPPDAEQNSDSALVAKYYRPSDFIIRYGESVILYAFGWDGPAHPQRISIDWAPATQRSSDLML